MRYPAYIESEFDFPVFYRVEMRYPEDDLLDVEEAVHRALDDVLPGSGIRRGHRVAVAVGSRGIDRLPVLVGTVCRRLKSEGAVPFIIPAMGSHGGATDEGQANVLTSLGVTPETCGAPVVSSLAVEQVGDVFGDVPVYFSRDALAADSSICINRIKPHTKFKAVMESGLLKMLSVGMGKHAGALSYHRFALKYGFGELLSAMGQTIIRRANLSFGLAVVENARDRILRIEGIPAREIPDREPALLSLAKSCFPTLPFPGADVLIIGRIGKEISGAGMDPNVTGRAYDLKESDFSGCFTAVRAAILNLSDKTKGNAIGIGNADFITEKVFQAMDYETTLMNALTSMSLRKAYIPIRMPTDAKAIQACFTTLGPVPAESVGAVLVKDTLHVAEFWVTRPLAEALRGNPRARVMAPTVLEFDENGSLRTPDLT